MTIHLLNRAGFLKVVDYVTAHTLYAPEARFALADTAEEFASRGELEANGYVDVEVPAQWSLSGVTSFLRLLPEHFTVEVI